MDVVEMLRQTREKKNSRPITFSAPMVRYSTLPFRMLCHNHGCDVVFSPMIVAKGFNKSEQFRNIELQTDPLERPLLVQFASKDAEEFVTASEYVVNQCEGVNLNCGCPSKKVRKVGLGSALLDKPELIADIIKTAHSRLGEKQNFSVSAKIRLLPDQGETIELCKRIEKMHSDFIIIHARNRFQRDHETPNYEMMSLIRDSIQIPIVANGSIFNQQDWELYKNKTRCEGVMSARGLLKNPGMFEGSTLTKPEYVQELWDLIKKHKASHPKYETTKKMFSHIANDLLTKNDRILLLQCKNEEQLEKFLSERDLLN
ncbi:tRNA-dihydrouridine(20a/20b) synthase [NADP(+)] [Anaeramoeba flamelloides]|uniref:tRNA-dihydrouridine synthase n=1 Tax=Anaeramoeba flamelloides TaxID=1746091 RepID=A0ABQ8XVW3_9EUKA|nr:tRNA-dihydrouridine(20a/20b) synthase [NADP(+)] [Anaeramoeba flamelloides]